MAVTATLVRATGNRLTYLLAQDGQAGTALNITSTGAASPDLVTDTAGRNGAMRRIAKANAEGFGAIATPMTQAKARAVLLSDYSGASPSGSTAANSGAYPTARAGITDRGGAVADNWQVDANVSGNNMVLAITAPAAAASVMLDIEVPGAIGV
jgi:hypothetical protein